MERLEKMKRKKPTFSSVEFKQSASKRITQQGIRPFEAAQELGVPSRLLFGNGGISNEYT